MSQENKNKLNRARVLVMEQLQTFASRGDFWTVFAVPFGQSYDPNRGEALRSQWLSGEGVLPTEIVSQQTLGNAVGAYGKGKIFLSEQFIANGTSSELVRVLLEEYGHHVDAQVNVTDSLGDEGAIFAAVVQGEILEGAALAQLRAEDDSNWISVDGERVLVEESGSVTRTPIAPASSGRTRYEVGNGSAFAALKSDGSVVTWGFSDRGGDSSSVASQLTSGVTQIFSNSLAFAALKSNGSVVTWGYSSSGGDSSSVASQLTSGVTQIFSTRFAFAALKSNGSVVTWGYSDWGGNSSSVASQLTSGVTQIFSTRFAFAALKSNGSVVTWGDSSCGGNSSIATWNSTGNYSYVSVASQLTSGVTQIFSTDAAFAALKSNGSVVTWGDSRYGGDSSIATWKSNTGNYSYVSVASQLTSGVVSFADPFNDDRLVLSTSESSVTLAVSPSSVTEDGSSNLVYTFTRTGVISNALTVNYTLGGTATSGTDYGTIGTSVTFAANSSTATVTVDPTADTTVESDETVSLTLASGTGYTIDTTSAVTGTITNDDTQVTLAVSPSSVTEDGSSNLVYTFTRTGDTANTLTVNYTVGGTATNGSDYGTIGTSVTFAANSSTATVTVDPTADTTVESDETVSLTLASSTSYTIGTTSAVTGTITNDDILLPVITLTVFPSSVTEDGPQNLFYTFIRSGDTANALTVNYTVGGTATFNSDYTQREAASFTNTSGSITFAPGASTATFIIDPASDTVVEGNESVSISLTSGTGYTIGTISAVSGSILDNDVTPGTVVRTPIAPALPDRTGYEVRNRVAFAALKSDGSVVTWGYSYWGGDSSSVASQLTSGVTQIFSNDGAFAALKSNGSVVTWGIDWIGGQYCSVKEKKG
ncbi:Calx-beta domain-containing protein [Cylindrospermopsis raciborskii]|uniref:Calx-beta domain-containing protein n=1 Tax=Cylindrospermopsis raciborskii CENA302 TaxID=1170768 RepID=A0A9Q5QW74_9CYAN|nr:Calx-beta domain-containing protein [Cylindrospermopsis raciborskii]OPH09315.1 hypothetical protein CENA302_11750 [Cylindrospermopsis raciborskii CENA302]